VTHTHFIEHLPCMTTEATMEAHTSTTTLARGLDQTIE
jgi:hypothetical protein